MTPEQQRICIAEACGWKLVNSSKDFGAGTIALVQWIAPDGKPEGHPVIADNDISGYMGVVPDYLSDLNAMHWAETVLKLKTRERFNYLVFLAKATNSNPTFATAAQRAEAFLKTLNLWKP